MQPNIRRAFTLMEMLVVISVIVLLIAILMPTFSGGRTAGRMAVCKSNLHQMGVAYKNLQTQGRAKFRSHIPTGWQGGLAEMMGNDGSIFHCPEGGEDPVGVFGGEAVAYVEILLYGAWRTHACEPSYFVRVMGGTHPGSQYKLGFESSHGNEGGGGDWDDLVLTFNEVGGEVSVTLDQQGDLRGGVNNASSNVGFKLFSPDGQLLFDSDISSHPEAGNVIGNYSTGGSKGFDYGMNNRAHELRGNSGKILIVDYTKIVASVVGPDARDLWHERSAPRHFDKLNVLFYGGQVELMSREEIDPEDDANNWSIHNALWKPDIDTDR